MQQSSSKNLKNNLSHKVKISFYASCCAIFFCVVVSLLFWIAFLRSPVVVNQDFQYILPPGSSADTLAHALHQKANLRFPTLFKLLVHIRFEGEQLKAGEYLFPVNSTPGSILNQVVSGNVYYHSFTIVNGWNFQKVMDALNHDSSVKHTLSKSTPTQIAKKLGIDESTPEGWLFPNTYHFTLGTTDVEVLTMSYQAMQNYLKEEWPKRDKNLPYRNQAQALIVASMIEKETSVENERPIVAAVILKRWKKWIPLQIDSTVIYGLGKAYKGQLTKHDLRQKTSYNTYRHYGLPPTPISMPSASAIYAALHPVETDALYFVAKGDGSHVFSATLKQHNHAVVKYQLDR